MNIVLIRGKVLNRIRQCLTETIGGVCNLFSVKQGTEKHRIEMLDFLRGTAMLLVLLHHAEIPFSEYILIFHMPLMFILSGFSETLTEKPITFTKYVKKRFFRLIVPYFFVEGLYLLVWSFSMSRLGMHQNFWDAIYSILTCVDTKGYTGYNCRTWFFPCLFVSDIYFYFIKRMCKGKLHRFLLYAVGLVGLSWFTCEVLVFRLPFTMDTAFLATAYLIIGYISARPIKWIYAQRHFLWDCVIFFAFFCMMHVCISVGSARCWMFENNYSPYFWTQLGSLSGSIAFFVGAKWTYAVLRHIKLCKNVVLWYGYNSLATYPTHLTIKIWIMVHHNWEYPWQLLLPILVIFNIPAVNFITKYFPFMLGNFSKKN